MQNVFKDNPKLKECYTTSDGTAFYNETDAKNYARTLENKDIKKMVRGEKSEALNESPDTKSSGTELNYRDAIKAIQEAESIDQLTQFESYPQPSVQKALQDKRAELTASITVESEDVTNNQE